ncbi:MAG: GtrA family protein [Ruminococcus sp.]|nr:GtrA family protein [Candidatus Copronaster equi]
MEKKKEQSGKKDSLMQAVKFALFSASAGIIQAGSYAALVFILKKITGSEPSHIVCYLPSLILSVLWNFTFNRKFTFKSANNVPVAMLKVAIYYAIFTPLSTYLGGLAELRGVAKPIIEAVSMLTNFVTEFIYDKFVVFRGSENTNDIAKKENEEK